MKKKLIATSLLVSLLLSTGCTQKISREWKDTKSSMVGLERTVTIYDYTGNIICTYQGTVDIEDTESGNKVKFDLDGKRHVIYNAIVIVDEQ